MDEAGYVHIVGCVDAAEASKGIEGRVVDYGKVRRTVRTVLDAVGAHLGGSWECVKFRVTNNDAGDSVAFHRDAVWTDRADRPERNGNDDGEPAQAEDRSESTESAQAEDRTHESDPSVAGFTVAVYCDDTAVDVVPGTHERRGLGCVMGLPARTRLRVRAGDVVVRSSCLISREVLTKRAASRRAIHMYGCYPSSIDVLAPRVAHATTAGNPVLNGAVMLMCALMPRSMGILSGLSYVNAALGFGAGGPYGAGGPTAYGASGSGGPTAFGAYGAFGAPSFIASEGFQPRADVGNSSGPTNVYVIVGPAPELDPRRAAEHRWVAYTRQFVALVALIVLVCAIVARITRRRTA